MVSLFIELKKGSVVEGSNHPPLDLIGYPASLVEQGDDFGLLKKVRLFASILLFSSRLPSLNHFDKATLFLNGDAVSSNLVRGDSCSSASSKTIENETSGVCKYLDQSTDKEFWLLSWVRALLVSFFANFVVQHILHLRLA